MLSLTRQLPRSSALPALQAALHHHAIPSVPRRHTATAALAIVPNAANSLPVWKVQPALSTALSPTPNPAQSAAAAMAAGKLVPDQTVLSLATERLTRPDCLSHGWVLDGLPRNVAQARELLQSSDSAMRPELLVELVVPHDDIRSRVAGRRIDPVTNSVYNINDASTRPVGREVCERLVVRDDDRADVVERRLSAFEREMPAVREAFKRAGVPVVRVEVPVGAGVEAVHALVMQAVGDASRIVLAGAPGCGKGTQGVFLADYFGGVHVSTGDLLREAARKGKGLVSERREENVGLVSALGIALVAGRRSAIQAFEM